MKVKQISAVLSGALLLGSLSPSISQAATEKQTAVKQSKYKKIKVINLFPFKQTNNLMKHLTQQKHLLHM
ncbi:hypothetical protein ACTFRP_30080 [Bacillus cereus group sp. MYBK234-1]|uniref:hypothetical protein n=1 Tax=unclassified Bacillus cereus group TaxID=2750818 RepID=UPI003F7A1CDB